MWVPLGIFVIRSFRPEETRFDCAPEKLVLKPSSQSRPNVSSILFYGDAIVLFWVILLSVFRLRGFLLSWRMWWLFGKVLWLLSSCGEDFDLLLLEVSGA
jgi:hypothetical protein